MRAKRRATLAASPRPQKMRLPRTPDQQVIEVDKPEEKPVHLPEPAAKEAVLSERDLYRLFKEFLVWRASRG